LRDGKIIDCPACGARLTFSVRRAVRSGSGLSCRWSSPGAFCPIAAVSICALGLLALAHLPTVGDPGSRSRAVTGPLPVVQASIETPQVVPAIPNPVPPEILPAQTEMEMENAVSGKAKEVEMAPKDGRTAAIRRGRELFTREWMPDDPRSHGG